MIQLFYRGTDNTVITRWHNSAGSWSGELRVQDVINGDPIAAQVPGTNILQLFYRGTNNSVYSRWRNPDGSWSDEQHVGGVLNGDPIAAQAVPATGQNYTIVLIFWGLPQPPNQSKWPSTLTSSDLSNALTAIANGGYFSLLSQYSFKLIGMAGPPTMLTQPPWPPGDSTYTTRFTMTDITNFITHSFSSGVPSPDKFSNITPVYIVITPRGGLMTDDPNSVGEHGTFHWGPTNRNVIYAYVDAQSDLNDTIAVATHEIVEALGANGGAPKELCDDCQKLYGQGVSAGIGTFSVASYLDAATNQCVAPPSFHKPA
jgi:hypothetical protein